MDKNVNFGAATHVYFYTPNGQRIVSDDNIRICQRYVIRQLNNAKNLKSRNQELIDTFSAGDADYRKTLFWDDKKKTYVRKARSVYEHAKDRAKAFVNIITGREDIEVVEGFGKEIGKAKHIAKERTGSAKSFETSYAADRYNFHAPRFADNRGIYQDGKRQAFKVVFEPQYKKNGELKGFEYNSCGFVDEETLIN